MVQSVSMPAVALMCLVAVGDIVGTAVGADLDATKFRETYSAASERLEEQYGNIRAKGTLQAHDGMGKVEFRALDDVVVRITVAHEASLFPKGARQRPCKSMVLRIGGDYRFLLKQPGDQDPYVLLSLDMIEELAESARSKIAGEKEIRIDQFLKASFFYYGKPIREWLQRDDFQVDSVTRRNDPADTQLVEVRFTVTLPDGTRSDLGRFVFLPDLDWVLKESETHATVTSGERKIRAAEGARLSYPSSRGRKAIFPNRVEIFQTDRDLGQGGTQVFSADDVEVGTVRAEELTLTAFGLPDIAHNRATSRTRPMRWWLWAALGGGALLALGAVFGWWRQRATR